jgi:pyruvate,water dikinase
LTRWLDDIDGVDTPEVGGKAAALGSLRRTGLPVPNGFVVTAAGPSVVLSPAESEQVVAAARQLGGAVAVRSSAIAEDGPDLSYAGQFTTVLDVDLDDSDALIDAVHVCLASTSRSSVRAYRSGEHQMAVLVQRMVHPDAAGVAFTADPVTGDAETRINAVPGLGNRLAAGAIDAEEWVVLDGTARLRSAQLGAINAEQARAVAGLAERVADHFGADQDIEWAIADGDLFLLQARPITALPIAVVVEPPAGFWVRERVHAPDPLSPMMCSIFRANDGLHRAAEEFGLLVTPTGRQIGGWEYGGVVPVGAPAARPAPPALVLAVLARVVPALRRRIRQCRTAVRTDRTSQIIEQWYANWRPELIDRIRVLSDVDLGALDNDGLRRHLTDTDHFIAETAPIHFIVDFAHMMAVGELGLAMQELLGWPDSQVFELLAGLSISSTEPAHALADLAAIARTQPIVLRALEDPAETIAPADLKSLDPALSDAFAAYQDHFGCRALHADVLQPTIGESPGLTLGLLRDQLGRGYDPTEQRDRLNRQRSSAEAAARTAIPEIELAGFERLLARAQRAYPAREDNEVYTLTIPLGLTRLAALESGRRLTTTGQLDQPEDVFFHQLDHVCAALGDSTDLRPVARRRRRERAWIIAHPGPSSYGPEGGRPPSLAGFPKDVKRTAQAFSWARDRATPTTLQPPRPDGLSGIAASPGRYQGPVRVILDEAEFHKIQPGDILVCPITSPVWSLLFPSIGALITDVGGSLSHPAIIAREYGIPAIMATGRATEILHDGQIVTVDGTTGVIDINP